MACGVWLESKANWKNVLFFAVVFNISRILDFACCSELTVNRNNVLDMLIKAGCAACFCRRHYFPDGEHFLGGWFPLEATAPKLAKVTKREERTHSGWFQSSRCLV